MNTKPTKSTAQYFGLESRSCLANGVLLPDQV